VDIPVISGFFKTRNQSSTHLKLFPMMTFNLLRKKYLKSFLLVIAAFAFQAVAFGQIQRPIYQWSFASPSSKNGAVFTDSIASKTLKVNGDSVFSVQGVRNSTDKAISFPIVFAGNSRCPDGVACSIVQPLLISLFPFLPG
jgi:hypothetical protein